MGQSCSPSCAHSSVDNIDRSWQEKCFGTGIFGFGLNQKIRLSNIIPGG